MSAKSVVVVAPDGRRWTVRRTATTDHLYWSWDDDFEHNVGGSGPMTLLSFVVPTVGLWAALTIMFPMTDPIRVVAVAVALLALLLYPLLRLVHLTWFLVAETTEDHVHDYWAAAVYGVARADEEMELAARAIRKTGRPVYPASPFLSRD